MSGHALAVSTGRRGFKLDALVVLAAGAARKASGRTAAGLIAALAFCRRAERLLTPPRAISRSFVL